MGARDRQSSKAILFGLVLITMVGLFASRHLISRKFFSDTTDGRIAAVEPAAVVPLISPTDGFQKWLANDGTLFVDIRSRENFEFLHIPRSRSVLPDELRTIQPEEEKPLIVIAGAEDTELMQEANKLLLTRSFPYFFLSGGFDQWVTEGKPTISIGNPTSFIDQSKVTYLSVGELKKFLESHESPVQFLDVRSRSEFKTKHVRNAINLPVESIEAEYATLPVGRTFVVYGGNEVEAFRAAVKLFDLNISTARAIRGSFDDIVKAGIATMSGL